MPQPSVTQQNEGPVIMTSAHGNNVRGERSKLDQTDMHPLFCPVYVLDRRMQEGTSPPK
jgi:hypothetical protein